MKKIFAIMAAGLLLGSSMLFTGCKGEEKQAAVAPASQSAAVSAPATQMASKTGEDLFQQYCAACHRDGGNIIKAEKTLQQKSLEANGIKSAADIIGKMRNPAPGMTKFDSHTLVDEDAQKIAEYIMATFK